MHGFSSTEMKVYNSALNVVRHIQFLDLTFYFGFCKYEIKVTGKLACGSGVNWSYKLAYEEEPDELVVEIEIVA